MEANPLYLSDSFQPDVNSLLRATALLCGMRRSGKSNAIAVMAEELGRYYCPLCIGDTDDEYGPLSSRRYLPRGVWAASPTLAAELAGNAIRRYLALAGDGAYAFGQASEREEFERF